ncbi:uncharacterized protein KD926_004491 [Aspergillus affinis]|uniref:uncharacterized protein n=1 Tax=Aspergillus affinis TaxID=1070780 RepID=UPI0022FE1532|nr:uncharacterized protein KD926_004491 [Aspergillus affinis]KAI9035140.1 hypothetical protein KD926_004491 [Aspergillus affinis]
MQLSTLFLAVLTAASTAMAHMEMIHPFPLKSPYDPKNKVSNIDINNTHHLKIDGSNFPCRGHHKNAPWRTVTTYTAGQKDYMELAPGINHNDGSCQISLSYDNGETFRVIQSYMGGCPLKLKWDFQIPEIAPAGDALFGWSWFNLEGRINMGYRYGWGETLVAGPFRDSRGDAQQYLSFNESNGKQLPKPVVSFIQQVADACDFLQHQIVDILTANCRIGSELANIRQTLQNVQEQTYYTQSSVQKQNNQSWASVVRNAPPPAHTISSHGSFSTAPATPSELSKDREVIVKLRDAGALSLAKTRFVAARQLRSGDLSLSLRYAAEAEAARTHDQWVNYLSAGAMLRRPSWGIVIHGIAFKSIGDLTTDKEQQRVANELLEENRDCWNQKSSALIVEFLDPRHANEAIARGTIWDSVIHKTVLYDRTARIRRSAAVQGVEKHTLPGTKGVRGTQQRWTGFKLQQCTGKPGTGSLPICRTFSSPYVAVRRPPARLTARDAASRT